MSTRLLTADRIHNGHSFLAEGSVLEVTDDGRIVTVHSSGREGAEYFNGILCPGFVNAHCHLELSHMRDIIPKGTGLIPFLQTVVRQRTGFMDEQKKAARHEAYNELLRNGVVAVGDIANTTDTLDLRAQGGLHTHTFVECIGFSETGAAARFAYAKEGLEAFAVQQSENVVLRQSVVPHAPYSVSPELFWMVNEAEPGSLISIHNQEGEAEDEYYRSKTGPVRDLLEGFAIDDAFFKPSGKSSLQTYLPLFGQSHPMLLVHNTCSSADDVAYTQDRQLPPFWCLCPNANLYIEERLPDVMMIASHTDNICIGTDSLASNSQFSILAELKVLDSAFPAIGWERLLRWATGSGAKALQMERIVGSFSEGLKPGVLHISDVEKGSVLRVI
jgi:cytosine/adenosine deaminase-related metal-dependent hydrolase